MSIPLLKNATEFVSSPEVSKDDLWRLWDKLHEDAKGANHALLRRLATITILWLASYGISERVVSGATLASLKLERLDLVILAAPVAIAAVCHDAAALLSIVVAGRVVRRVILQRLFPHFRIEHLETMTLTTSATVEAEHLLAHGTFGVTSSILLAGSIILPSLIVIVPMSMFAHTLVLAMSQAQIPLLWRLLVAVLASAIFLRALGLLGVALRVINSHDSRLPQT
jgi:hypothetical protein